MSSEEDYFSPEGSQHSPESEPPPPEERSGCLTAFLVVVMAANALGALFYVVGGGMIRDAMPDLPGWGIFFLAFMSLVNVACGFAVWRWKRIGVVGFGVSALIAFVFNLSFGDLNPTMFAGLIGPVILMGLVSKAWSNMKWI